MNLIKSQQWQNEIIVAKAASRQQQQQQEEECCQGGTEWGGATATTTHAQHAGNAANNSWLWLTERAGDSKERADSRKERALSHRPREEEKEKPREIVIAGKKKKTFFCICKVAREMEINQTPIRIRRGGAAMGSAAKQKRRRKSSRSNIKIDLRRAISPERKTEKKLEQKPPWAKNCRLEMMETQMQMQIENGWMWMWMSMGMEQVTDNPRWSGDPTARKVEEDYTILHISGSKSIP